MKIVIFFDEYLAYAHINIKQKIIYPDNTMDVFHTQKNQ